MNYRVGPVDKTGKTFKIVCAEQTYRDWLKGAQ